MQSQTDFVLNHLASHGSITDITAQGYRIRRLAARIHDLRSAGYSIKAVPCRDDFGQRFVRYELAA